MWRAPSSGRGPTVRPDSPRRPSAFNDSEQAIVFLSHDCVTLASTFFQSLAVENLNVTTHVADQPFLLQILSSVRHAFAAYAQHVRDEFLSHLQLVGMGAVAGHQQPAAESLFYWVQAVANGGLRDLRDQGLGVAEQQLLKITATTEL